MTYQTLLYYKYIHIEDPEALMKSQRQLCLELGLKGRIIIAAEGLNGTVEGELENTEKYVNALREDVRFADIHMKRSQSGGDIFPKLSIKVRDEIVSGHLGEDDVDPSKMTATHLDPAELHEWFKSGKKFTIVDMRNDYEHWSGHFKGSVLPPMRNFRELPDVLPGLEQYKNETVLTVCTGGVRCEKASGYLLKKGFNDVYQLNGGIVSYMEAYPGEDFLGSLYVFDKRVTMGFNHDDPNRTIVGRCEACGSPSEHYINCANNECHVHFICCENCSQKEGGTMCPEGCKAVTATA